MEVHGWLYRPARASAGRPCPAVVQPHGGPTSLTGDEWDGVAQYFVDKGYAWFAINFRGSTTYGRDFERADHGVWGVADTARLPRRARPPRRPRLGRRRTRIAIFGASYGSYMALHSVVDDPQHRFRVRGREVRRLRHPHVVGAGRPGRPARPRADDGPPPRRSRRSTAPARRSTASSTSPCRSSSPTASSTSECTRRSPSSWSTRCADSDKQYEYVTYPTEGHGLLRTEPFLHFHRRLERFLDWHLMP